MRRSDVVSQCVELLLLEYTCQPNCTHFKHAAAKQQQPMFVSFYLQKTHVCDIKTAKTDVGADHWPVG